MLSTEKKNESIENRVTYRVPRFSVDTIYINFIASQPERAERKATAAGIVILTGNEKAATGCFGSRRVRSGGKWCMRLIDGLSGYDIHGIVDVLPLSE